MTSSKPTVESSNSLTQDVLYAIRYYLSGRRGLWALAAALVVGGAALNWSWLVAAGVVPILFGVLPCAAMCALGLCMNKMGANSRSSQPSPDMTEKLPRPDVDRVASVDSLSLSAAESPPRARENLIEPVDAMASAESGQGQRVSERRVSDD